MTQYPRRSNPQQGGATRPPGAPKRDNYLEGGYFDDKGNIKCELLTSVAQQKAKELGDSDITSTQLRSFFTQVRSIERELEGKEFPQVVARIQRLEYLAANYVGRGQNNWDRQKRETLKKFIDSNSKLAARDNHNFKDGFIPHFEAVIAFFKYFYPRK